MSGKAQTVRTVGGAFDRVVARIREVRESAAGADHPYSEILKAHFIDLTLDHRAGQPTSYHFGHVEAFARAIQMVEP